SASGSTASRVRMRYPPQHREPLLCITNCLLDARGSCPPGNIVDPENRLQRETRIKFLVECPAEFPQLIKREVAQLAAFLEAALYGLSDLFMREPERHAVPYQIGGCCPRIHESRLCGCLHPVVIEFDFFRRDHQCSGITDDSRRLSTHQFQQVRIFLLRHGTATG